MQIALVGTTLSRARAPYADPSWTVWAHACAHALPGMAGKRVDAWFDLHTPAVRQRPKSWSRDYPAWLARADRAPIYLQAADPSIPHSRTFPRDEIEQALGAVLPEGPYFTSSLSWMLALAVLQRPKRIGIWGCNFAQTQEYRVQRPCAEYWIGVARARGIAVEIDKASPLVRSRHVYGYGGDRPDLMVEQGMAPRPLVIVPPSGAGDDVPPLMAIPPAIQALIDQQKELYGEL